MAEGKRNRLSIEQRIEMWRRWKAGESLHDIGRAFGKAHNSIRFLLKQRGGIVPAARRRSPRTLTLAEREDISRGIASGLSIRAIASGLQRPVSTVSREVLRHGGRPLYRASEADRQAWESALENLHAEHFDQSEPPHRRESSSGSGHIWFRFHPQLSGNNQHGEHRRADGEDTAHAGVLGQDARKDQTYNLCAEDR